MIFESFAVLCLMLACYQIGRIIGRGEITFEDQLWKERIDNGYGDRS